MNIEKIEKIEYAAYEKSINIDLFNEVIAFMISTRIGEDSWTIFREIEKKCIWVNKVNGYTIQEKYEFHYIGELLERYEERIGNDIKDIRAIALALGYATKLVENNMIVGTQLVNFISKINKLAENDIYLKGALYLYDSKKYYMYSEEFMNKNFISTEEIIFALSIFYERIDDFFYKNKVQIINLIGKSRNISIIGNIGIYAWLIKNLYPLICKDRKKDISLLKALIKVPTGLQKEGTSVYNELVSNGYSKEEIVYLNYLILYYNTVPNSVRLGYSIVEEKIAINLCKILINSENSHPENIYDLLQEILYKYDRFHIKCYGYCKIKDAIKTKINVTNPTTFTKLFYVLDSNLYSFNILDKKWDIVATEADSKKYEKIFDYFLLFSSYNKEKLNECINKYNDLTNKKYFESFLEYDSDRKSIFKLLVDNNVIQLKEVFKCILETNKQNQDNHIKKYIEGIGNKKSFEFLKYLLRLNKYSITEISDFGFDFENLIHNYSYTYKSRHKVYYLDIERKFLNIKEYRILFSCLEKFIFYNKPDIYLDFLEELLNNNMICKLYKKSELRQLYLSLCEMDPETYKNERLQNKYLTFEELNAIYEQKRLEEELEKKKELLEAEEFITNKFNEITEKNSFENLYSFCDKYKYNNIKSEFCMKIAKKYILDNIYLFPKENNEIIYLMQIIQLFMKKESLTTTEFIKIIYEYIKEEVKENESINATC